VKVYVVPGDADIERDEDMRGYLVDALPRPNVWSVYNEAKEGDSPILVFISDQFLRRMSKLPGLRTS